MYKKLIVLACLMGSMLYAADNAPVGAGAPALVAIDDDQPVPAPVGLVAGARGGVVSPRVGAGFYVVRIENPSYHAVEYEVTVGEELYTIADGHLLEDEWQEYHLSPGDYTIFYNFPTSPNAADRIDENGGMPTLVFQVINSDIMVELIAAG